MFDVIAGMSDLFIVLFFGCWIGYILLNISYYLLDGSGGD